jgi:hypothetical protein
MAKTIRQRRHRATLNRAEQRLDPIVEPYDERHRAERLEILWNEAHPHLLARANDDDRKQQDEYVCSSSKTSASPVAMFHETQGVKVMRRWHSASRASDDELVGENFLVAEAQRTKP